MSEKVVFGNLGVNLMDAQHIEVIVTSTIIAFAVWIGVSCAVISLVFAKDVKKFIKNRNF